MADGYISQITLPDNNSYQLKDKTVDKIYYGTCSTVAGTAQKDVVVANADFTNDNLILGTILFVTFTATNSAAVGGLTLKVGTADAKPLKRLYNASATENIPDKGYLLANQTYPFYYNGTNWVVWMQYNTNSTYYYESCYSETGASTAAKIGISSSYVLPTTAGHFAFWLKNSNTAQNKLTLAIKNGGTAGTAKDVWLNGTVTSSSNYTWPAGFYIGYYDGTVYHFRTDGKLPGSITGDAATVNGLTVQTAVPENALFTDHYDWEDITNKPSTATSWPAWNLIRQTGANNLNLGSSDVTASTEILTSYASNNGFSDSNGLGIVYRRAASKVVNATLVKAALGINSTHNNNFLRKDGSWSTIQSASTSTAGIVKLYDGVDSTSTTLAATANAVKTAYDKAAGIVAAADAMVFKGVMSGAATSSNSGAGTLTPAADRGWTYKVDTAGYINGLAVEVGDIIICTTDSTPAATTSGDNKFDTANIHGKWVIVLNNVDGAVFKGSNAFVNNEIITADLTSGKVKSSGKSFSTATPTSSSADTTIPTSKAVWNAIAALDVDNATSGSGTHITGFDAGKTLATLTETDGKIAATFQNIAISITADATDGYWDLTGTNDNATNKVKYSLAPYSSKLSGANFYTGTENPDGTTRLNYNGYLYATKLYSDGTEVSVSGHTHTLSIATDSGTTNLVSLSANTTYKLTAGGSTLLFKTPADSDTKLQIAAVTSGTTYYPIVAANSTSAATRQYDATGFAYLGTNGTTSVVGVAKITLGNATSSGSANNKQGSIGLYGSTAYLTTIISGAPTAANTVTLPTGSGTLALVGDNSHSHGNINSGGCITTAISITENDYLIIGDNSDNGKLGKGPVFDASTESKVLSKKGTWVDMYTHPTDAGHKHIPSGGSSGQFLGYDSAGTAKWVNNPNTDTHMNVSLTTATISHNYILMTSTAPTSTAALHTGLGATSLWVNSADKGKFELVLGNSTSTGSSGGQYGLLALYSESSAGTYLKAASGSSWKTATLPAATGMLAMIENSAAKGSNTKPIKIAATGLITECDTYAGGTAVTLNGTSKAASTASLYAATSAGTTGLVLKSTGTGEPEWEDEYRIEIIRL